MPAYAYPIQIKRERQKVRYHKSIKLENEGIFTIDELSKLVTHDERFSIVEREYNSMFGKDIFLSITGERLETDEELNARIEKEEKYMAEYNKRHDK